MSWKALAWATDCHVPRAADKLVLFALAYVVNEESGHAYPSIEFLCKFTSLNRKTVIASLGRLEEGGLIADTHLRTGKTKKVKVYTLNHETVPKTGPFPEDGKQSQKRYSSPSQEYQKRYSSPAKEYQKRDTEHKELREYIPLFVSNDTNNGDLPIERLPDPDPDRAFWDAAKGYLASYSKNPGALIGKWLREHGKEQTAQAITSAQIEHAVDPVAYIGGYFRRHGNSFQPTVPL